MRIRSEHCSGGQKRDNCAQMFVWEGWEWCLEEFALGELDCRSRECIDYWRITSLEAKIKTVKRFENTVERLAKTIDPIFECVRQACHCPMHVRLPLSENYDRNKTDVEFQPIRASNKEFQLPDYTQMHLRRPS